MMGSIDQLLTQASGEALGPPWADHLGPGPAFSLGGGEQTFAGSTLSHAGSFDASHQPGLVPLWQQLIAGLGQLGGVAEGVGGATGLLGGPLTLAEGSVGGGGFYGLGLQHQLDMGLLGSHTNTTQMGVYGDYRGRGALTLGADGLTARGDMGFSAGNSLITTGQYQNPWGGADYRLQAGVEVLGEASGQATLNGNGLQATAHGEVGATLAAAEFQGDFRTPGVAIGDHTVDVNGHVQGEAFIGAKAEGEANVDLTLNPPAAAAEIGGSAFAGARAGIEGTVGIGDFASITGKAEAWAGAGAEGLINIGFKDGELQFSIGGGAAVKAGMGFSVAGSINFPAMADAALDALSDPLGTLANFLAPQRPEGIARA